MMNTCFTCWRSAASSTVLASWGLASALTRWLTSAATDIAKRMQSNANAVRSRGRIRSYLSSLDSLDDREADRCRGKTETLRPLLHGARVGAELVLRHVDAQTNAAVVIHDLVEQVGNAHVHERVLCDLLRDRKRCAAVGWTSQLVVAVDLGVIQVQLTAVR